MEIKVSIGEIIDKLTILSIKKFKIKDIDKLSNIENEHDYLFDIVFNKLKVNIEDFNRLKEINERLWKIEDDIRVKEKRSEFDNDFIQLARLVYITNDIRSEVKKELNLKYKSEFIEEKSY
jgi:hypothetical protein